MPSPISVKTTSLAGRWLALTLVAGVCAIHSLSGCISYVATVDRTLQHGTLRLHIEGMTGRPSKYAYLSFVVDGAPDNKGLLAATISGATVPCSAGWQAWKAGRAPGRTLDSQLTHGERVNLQFAGEALMTMASARSYLDLLLATPQGDARCFRFPLSVDDKHAVIEMQERWTLGLDLAVIGFPAELGPINAVPTFPLTVGYWLGAWHLEVGAGFGSAHCPEDHCEPEDEDTRGRYAATVPIIAGLTHPIFERGELSLGLGLRYYAMPLLAETRSGNVRFWMHGAALVPYIGGGPPRRETAGVIGGSRAGLVAVEIPLGYALASNGRHSLLVGAALRFRLTLL